MPASSARTTVPTIKPNHKAIIAYREALDAYGSQYVTHETALRSAFQNLLADTAKGVGWLLVPEETIKVGGKSIRPDGTMRDANNLRRGYWEAKDTNDKLDDEIRKKTAKGYPLTNTIFEDTTHAALYQNGSEEFRADLTKPEQIADLLNLFYRYTEPDIEGFEQAVAEFKDHVPDLAQGLVARIKDAHKTNKRFQDAYAAFFELCKTALNPNISEAAVDEMLVQHLLTERLIRKIFDNSDFMNNNVIAVEIEKVIRAMTSGSFSREDYLKALDRFYRAIEDAAHNLEDYHEKQTFLNTVYERFFQGYSVKVADTHGIVYTPQPIVDFMCASVVEVLQTEFGKTLGDKDVVILDPATGTGSFIANLLRRANKADLPALYKDRLFANEIMLLPYYIAALNIEHTYYELTGSYETFEGLCFVDTLDIAEGAQMRLGFMTEENSVRVERQKKAPITVIIGNPPYNVGQANENDNNKNRTYEVIDKRVAETYSHDSKATSRSKLNDPYVKFFRWAVDRLQGRDGVICYVSNNSFVDQIAFDGMRKHLMQDFSRIYHIDLHGNVRQNPKLSGTTHNVFGIQVGVGITLAVRSSQHKEKQLFYYRVPELWRKDEKLGWLAALVRENARLTFPAGVGDEELTPPPSPLPASDEGESEKRNWGGVGDEEQEARGWATGGALWEKLRPLAKQMRTNPTEAEKELWKYLKDKQQGGIKFRRQHAFDRFIADFYCPTAQLIIEVDGSIHDYTVEEDAIRQAYLESLGLRVLRFTNDQVMHQPQSVVSQINQAVSNSLPKGQSEPTNQAPSGSGSPSSLAGRGLGGGVNWRHLIPDSRNTWRVPENAADFSAFFPIGSKEAKARGVNHVEVIFRLYSLGVNTNRDETVYDFNRSQLEQRVNLFIEDYNGEVDRYKRSGKQTNADVFVKYDRIKWSEGLKVNLIRGHYAEFSPHKVRLAARRPFSKQYVFFDEILNERRYLMPQIFPKVSTENMAICCTNHSQAPFMVQIVDCLPDAAIGGRAGQCFPFYIYNPDGSNRRENITDWALAQFRDHYGDPSISKWDIFYYVYGVLHHPDYRTKFADNLKRELPRIPFAPEFRSFADAGRKLADLHLNYETVEPYKLKWIEAKDTPLSYHVDKMRLNKDKSAVAINDSLTLAGIPPEAFEYRLGNRSALDWVIDQYQVTTDKRSGITSDPNRADDEKYIVELVGRVVAVSVATVEIVKALPADYSAAS